MSEAETVRYLSVTETAKLLRASLKSAFPGVKFSVRSDKYAGGASIHVKWTDGPTEYDVDRIAQLYSGATFDGMQDLKEYHDSILVGPDGPEVVSYGADFVFSERSYSPGFLERLCLKVSLVGIGDGFQCDHCRHTITEHAWRVEWVDERTGSYERAAYCCCPIDAAKILARHTDAR